MASQSNFSTDAGGGQDTIFDPSLEAEVGSGRALLPGTLLLEYEVQRVLSESGFAVVYLAKDPAVDRWVVIKEYQPTTLAQHSYTSRAELRGPAHASAFKRGKHAFMSESSILASCKHPSLLHVDRVWDANGTIYRVMPYYAGKSLQLYRQAAAKAPDEASLRVWLDGLLGALAVLHEHDCIHGAVAPDNILVLADGSVVLMDFGAVRQAIVSLETQRLMASLESCYLAPEQLDPAVPERVPGPWSDVYSVAAVLYFCIAGDFPKASKREPMDSVVRNLQRRQPDVRYSSALLHAIDISLAQNPHDRPSSVRAFQDLLGPPPACSTPLLTVVVPAPAPSASASAWPAVTSDRATATPTPAQPPPKRLPLSLEEMMAESEQRLAAHARGELPQSPPAASGPQRPPSKPSKPSKSPSLRSAVVPFTLVLLVALAYGGMMLFQRNDAQPSRPAEMQARATRPSLAPAAGSGFETGDGPLSPELATLQAVDPPLEPASEMLFKPPSAGMAALMLPDQEAKPGKEFASPRDACGDRSEFSLYNCMQTQCARGRWSKHLQCQRLRDTDEIMP